jgi:serine/threonine protein kinase
MNLSTFADVDYDDVFISDKGEYRILRDLGSGSFGRVYQTTNRRVIKEIVGMTQAQFEQEALVQMKVYEAVPNSCPKIYDVGVLEDDYEHRFVIVMEQFDGTAQKVLRQSPATIPEFLRQVAILLQKLEPFEFNHRDFKSDNVVYNLEGGKVRFALIDFGFACITVGGKKYAGTSYFKKDAKCFRKSRDLAQMVYELEKYTPNIPENIRTFLRLLLTFDINGTKCEMFKGCPPHKIDRWLDTYNFLDNDAVENPNTTPEGMLRALDFFEEHGIEACKNGFVVHPAKEECVPKPSAEVVTPKDKPVTPGAARTSKKCPEGKELNPATRRCIKKCPPPKVRNPKTRRCVKKLKT